MPELPQPPPAGHLTCETRGNATCILLSPEPLRTIADAALVHTAVLTSLVLLFLLGLVSAAWIFDPWLLGRAVFTAFGLPFAALCIYGMIHTTRRLRHSAATSAILLIDNNTLTIDITAPAPEHHAWPAASIRSITAARTKKSTKEHKELELSITTPDGETRLFASRRPDDLHWLATTLTHLLALPTPASRRTALFAETPTPPNPDHPVPPKNAELRTQPSTLASAVDAALRPSSVKCLPAENALLFHLTPGTQLLFYCFAAAWLLLDAIFLVVAFASRNPLSILICVAFAVPGLLMLFLGRHTATAWATAHLTRDTLTLRWKIVRSHEVVIPAATIEAIRVGPRHHDDSPHLLIDLTPPTTRHFFGEFPEDDLHALARALNLALGLTTPA